MPDYTKTGSRRSELIGINAEPFAAVTYAITSNPIGVEGFNWATVSCSLDFTACTNVRMYVDITDEEARAVAGTDLSSVTWKTLQELRPGATAGSYTTADWYITTPTLGADDHWAWNFLVNARYMRLRFTNPANNAVAADTLTVSVKMAVL